MEGLQFLNEFFKGIFELEETYWAQPFHYSDEKKKKKDEVHNIPMLCSKLHHGWLEKSFPDHLPKASDPRL